MTAQEKYKIIQKEIETEIAGIQLKLIQHEKIFNEHKELGYTSDLIYMRDKLKIINSFLKYDY